MSRKTVPILFAFCFVLFIATWSSATTVERLGLEDLVKKAEVDTLKEAMEQGVEEGCQTFDYVLLELYKEGKITL